MEDEFRKKQPLPSESCCCDTPGWNMPYSKFLEKLERYRIINGHSCDFCGLGRGVFEDTVITGGSSMR